MRQILALTTKVVYFYKIPFLVVLNHHLDFRKDSKLIYIQGDVKNPSAQAYSLKYSPPLTPVRSTHLPGLMGSLGTSSNAFRVESLSFIIQYWYTFL